jgi:hypothetical protein
MIIATAGAGAGLAIGLIALKVAIKQTIKTVVRVAERTAIKAAERVAVRTTERAGVQSAERSAVRAAESCTANSFTAGTAALMADGTHKPIEDVRVGDEVLATDPESGVTLARPVVALIRHHGQHTLVRLTFDDGTVLAATDAHPFWNATTDTFTYAVDLKVGEKVRAADGRTLTITASTTYKESLTAYNLEIAGIHTYYAGDTPVLVHNSCEPDLDALNQAGATMDRNGLTAAGRALQKHSVRDNTVFSTSSTRFADMNVDAQNILGDILTAPGGSIVPRAPGVLDIFDSAGRGARFVNGALKGFLEPH